MLKKTAGAIAGGIAGMALQEAIAESENPLPVVFLTGQGDIPSSVTAMRRGAVDFLVKTAPKEKLIAAINRALARDSREREARTHLHELQSRFDQLTPREREVLTHVLKGRLNKQIAAILGIDERSIKRHRTNMRESSESRQSLNFFTLRLNPESVARVASKNPSVPSGSYLSQANFTGTSPREHSDIIPSQHTATVFRTVPKGTLVHS